MIRKTGILGGTFDPVHKGHIALAEAAGELCGLEEVVLLPASVPPHKRNQTLSGFQHRTAMLEIAVQDKPSLRVSTIEEELPPPSYTIDTLRYLQHHSPPPVSFFFITGADTFLDILSWKSYEKVLQLSHFIVFLRSGRGEERLKTLLTDLHYQKQQDNWYHEQFQKRVYPSSGRLPAISSSEIRALCASGVPIKDLVPRDVDEYIAAHRLYTG